MKFTCCISTRNGAIKDPSQLQTRSASPQTISHGPSPPRQTWVTQLLPGDGTMISTTASMLERVVCSHLHHRDVVAADDVVGNGSGSEDDPIDNHDDPIQIFSSDDAHMLRCRPAASTLYEDGGGDEEEDGESALATIFGIREENAASSSSAGAQSESDVRVMLLDPRWDRGAIRGGDRERARPQSNERRCNRLRGDWSRRRESSTDGGDAPRRPNDAIDGDARGSSDASSHRAEVKIVDLTGIQDARRRKSVGTTDEPHPCFDAPGKAFHLLRSVLDCNAGGLHSASPWNRMYYHRSDNDDGVDRATGRAVVALLVKDPTDRRDNERRSNGNDRFWDDVERREVDELLNFRTGDAAPSYFLHSASRLLGENQCLFDLRRRPKEAPYVDRGEILNGGCSSSGALLLVYRHLPPRDILSRDHSLVRDEKCEYVGCLRETYFEQTELDADSDPTTQARPVVKHRMVSPPYQSHEQEFPGLLNLLLKGIVHIREEAEKIPQWTAWPEENHYADGSWNVFPLCYTFPANDITQRKWIQKTCSFAPKTTELLRTLGPTLRTALFSRLDPGARLGSHSGWSDLANHVLRVHVPLVVPGGKRAGDDEREDDNYNTGLCGTWVDGCVETHEEGRVISFDDSKVHRAFNYSDEERIVLIVDLLRPKDLPTGTATGGHSDELDAFINGFGS